jgi:antitoxin (DNA-binding transcriptional repressor) of toxin-antitoxin stability system
MANRKILGLTEARKKFSRLITRVNQGQTTFITRYGKLCAALVPQPNIHVRADESFLSLRGTGKGLYGNVARYVATSRREWN